MANYYYINIYIILINTRVAFLTGLLLLAFNVSGQNHADIQLANEYLVKGDKKKAMDLYKDLSRGEANVPLIHNNYINLMIDVGAFDEAQEYLKRIMRRDPENMQYKLDVGLVYVRSGEVGKADRYFKEMSGQVRSNMQLAKMMSDYLAARSLSEYSIMALNECRNYLGNPYLFCLELAMLYRIQGQQDDSSEQIVQPLKPLSEQNLSIINIEIRTEEPTFLVQLLDSKLTVVKEVRDQHQVRFTDVIPGEYQIRLIIDRNKNRRLPCSI